MNLCRKGILLCCFYILRCGMGFSQSFSPSSLPSLALWLRSDTGVVQSGGNVSQWQDISGNNLHAIQNGITNQPKVFASPELNNKPIIRFDGNDSLLGGIIQNYNTSSLTVFIVAKGFSQTTQEQASGFITVGGVLNGLWLYRTMDLESYTVINNYGSNSQVYYQSGSLAASGFPYKVFTYQKNYGTDIKAFTNGVQQGTASGGISAAFTNGVYTIGSCAGYSGLKGEIAEVIVYTQLLNPTQRQQVETYIYNRYCPPVNLGADIQQNYSLCPVSLDAGNRFVNYLWSNGSTAQSIAVSKSGIYWVRTTDVFGRISSDTINVQLPILLLNANDTTICAGDTVDLSVNVIAQFPYTYLWQDNLSVTNTYPASAQGSYYATLTDTFACSGQTDTVQIQLSAFASTVTLGADTALCAGNKIGLKNPPSGWPQLTFFWSDNSSDSLLVIPVSGIYSVTVTDAAGCQGDDSIFVDISGNAPVVAFTGDSLCVNQQFNPGNNSYTIDTSSIVSYLWSFGDGISDTATYPQHTYQNSGTYIATLTAITSAGCKNTLARTVKVESFPNAKFYTSLACIQNTYDFYDSTTTALNSPVVSWNWNFGNGNSSQQPNPSVLYSQPGKYQVSLTVATIAGCSSSFVDSIQVVSTAPLPSPVSLISPSNGFHISQSNVDFVWNPSPAASYYTLEVAPDSFFQFSNLYSSIQSTHKTLSNFQSGVTYYWRVRAINVCGDYTTSAIYCFTYFTPASLADLSLWLRADTGVVQVGGVVSEWKDLSGNNLHASQSDNNLRPVQVTSCELNNMSTIRFDGSDDVLNGGLIPSYSTNSLTVFVLSKGYFQNLSEGAAGFINAGSVFNGLWIYRTIDAQSFAVLNNYGSNGQIAYNGGSLPYTGYPYTVFEVDKDFGSLLSIYENDSLVDFKTGGITGAFSNGNYNIGRASGYSTLNGEIAEVIVYTRLLTSDQRNLVQNYLYDKYAPPVNLGADVKQDYSLCPISLDAGCRYVSYLWSNGDTTQTTIITQGGNHWVRVKDVFGRVSADTINISLAYNGVNFTDSVICLNDTAIAVIQLPQSGYSYIWNTGAQQRDLTITNTGFYFCIAADSVGCQVKTDTIRVSIDSISLFSVLPPDTIMCSGNYISVDSSGFSIQNTIWNNSVVSPGLLLDTSGIYSVVVTTFANCSVFDTINILVNWQAPSVTFTPTNFCLGDTTYFLNTSNTASPDDFLSWFWDFGDGVTDTTFSSKHYYQIPGDYIVKAYALTDSGCSGLFAKSIKISAAPQANFSYPSAVCANSTTTFFDNSAVILNDSVASWLWTFGAADTSTLQIPSYEFNTQGVVNVQLIAATDVGCADTVTKTIEVFAPFQADFDFSNVCSGDSTRFIDITNSLSVVDWLWNFGDGTPFSVTKNPTHYYTNTGTYTVIMKVENAIGCIDTLQKSVTVFRQPDAAINSLIACEDVVFSPKDTITTYGDPVVNKVWNINGVTYSNIPPQYFFTDTGTYPISLKVYTQNGCADSTAALLKVKANPTANFSIFPLYGEAPADIQFTNLSSGGITYQWDFGDANTSLDENPSHTFQYNDTFNIILTAISQDGCEASIQRAFVVAPTTLDVAASDVEVVKTAQLNNSVQVKVSAEIANIGTRVVTDMKLYATLGSGGVLSEDWNGILPSGQTLTYSFNAGFIVAEPNADTYVCVEAVSVNNGEEEVTTENNNDCASLTDGMQLLGPAPNPVMSVSALGIILPKAGEVTINIMDLFGRYYVRDFKANMPTGRTDYMLNRQQFAVGEYFVRVAYNDERLVRKFVVK